ncbi:hypothetical protein [Bradyrhizobium prioriisuperbiae]|uniref:hypothetical protein n=1 Tax=Bradyrhizobium prioriisuperbiae TaxID=2854389 RepID=UPI0028EC081E|nr:hypothetical protein [Bradyrhizobium prioritasuperba]
MAKTGWSQKFFMEETFTTPKGRKLATLADARDYILSLPKSEQSKPHWQHAAENLIQQAELGPAFALFTNIGMSQALQFGESPEPKREKKRLRIGKRLPPKLPTRRKIR